MDRRAIGGVVGPLTFAASWAIGGLVKDGYSPVHDAISRLAAVGAETRPVMTGGFVVFGVGLVSYAAALRRCVDGAAWLTAAGTGLATIGVALAPLEHSAVIDGVHAVLAGVGYVTLTMTPLLAARPLMRRGHRALARTGLVCGGIAAVSLALTTTGTGTGFFQRLGLSAGDVWIIGSSAAMLSGRLEGPAAHGRAVGR